MKRLEQTQLVYLNCNGRIKVRTEQVIVKFLNCDSASLSVGIIVPLLEDLLHVRKGDGLSLNLLQELLQLLLRHVSTTGLGVLDKLFHNVPLWLRLRGLKAPRKQSEHLILHHFIPGSLICFFQHSSVAKRQIL